MLFLYKNYLPCYTRAMNWMSTGQFISMWQGTRVRLRAIEPSDWETYFAWNQDDEMSRGTVRKKVVPCSSAD